MHKVNHDEKSNLQCTIKIMMMNVNYYFLQSLKWGKSEVEELFKNPYLSVMLAVTRPNLFWDFLLYSPTKISWYNNFRIKIKIPIISFDDIIDYLKIFFKFQVSRSDINVEVLQ